MHERKTLKAFTCERRGKVGSVGKKRDTTQFHQWHVRDDGHGTYLRRTPNEAHLRGDDPSGRPDDKRVRNRAQRGQERQRTHECYDVSVYRH